MVICRPVSAKILVMKFTLLILLFLLSATVPYAQIPPFEKGGTYKTNIFDDSGTRIIAYDRTSQRVFSTNVSENKLDILDFHDIKKPYLVKQVDLSPYIGKVHAVAAALGIVAVVGEGSSPQSMGKILFFNQNGAYQSQYPVGPLPHMVTFSPSSNLVLVANEGVPDDSYTIDPLGSVTIFNISSGIQNISPAFINTVTFEELDSTAYDPLINIYGNDSMQLPSQDIEPEYIAVDSSSTKAYVTLQENNALAIIDIASATLDTVIGFGYKDYSQVGLDASDVANNINITTYNRLFGMYQPDGISTFKSGGQTYLATANEGASRTYTAYNEEIRMKDILLDNPKFSNSATLKNDTVLGRLKLTKTLGDPGDLRYENLYTFGGRSFSIWDDNGQLVWDSGDDFEQTLAQLYASEFNSDYDDNNSYKSRSDDRGPEPQAIAVGNVQGKTYAFIGLERMGGIMIYDVTDPTSPQFVMYELNRDFSKAANDPDAGDLGPEEIVFVPAATSFNGVATIFVSNQVSGTITIYQMGLGVGLEEGYALPETSIYPNPSKGIFNASETATYKVYNSAGKLIKTVFNYNQIDLTGEADGFYIIRNEEGQALRVIKK